MKLISALALIGCCFAPVSVQRDPTWGALVLINDTDATLRVSRMARFMGTASVDTELSARSTIKLHGYLPRGRSELRISAPLVSPALDAIVKEVNSFGVTAGPYEVRVSARDFEKSEIFDGENDWEEDVPKEPSRYATHVVSPGTPSFGAGGNATKMENWDGNTSGNTFVSLGCGGSITLGFELPDPVSKVRVHEVGPLVEATHVEVRTPGGWIDAGNVEGRVNEVALSPAQRVLEVRLTDLESGCGGDTSGADIDAVELLR